MKFFYLSLFQVDLTAKRKIFVPINKDLSHWVLLHADIPTRTVGVLDSLNRDNGKYLTCSGRYIFQLDNILHVWHRDSISCDVVLK